MIAGGYAAARTVATAAQVAAMVASRSEVAGYLAQAEALERRAVRLAHLDAEAYAAAIEALRGEERRDLGRRMSAAAEIPVQIAEAAADVSALAAELARTAEPDVRADAATAAALAEAAAASAAHLVAVNLTVSDGDPRLEAARAAAAVARAGREAALGG